MIPSQVGPTSPQIKSAFVAGAAAGDLTVTGVKVGMRLASVIGFGLTEGTPNTFSAPVDLTSEFTITDDDTINNTGGTSSADLLLLVQWYAPADGLL